MSDLAWARRTVFCRYTHMLGDKQWAYNDWLADACGDVDRLPEWRPLMYKVAGEQA